MAPDGEQFEEEVKKEQNERHEIEDEENEEEAVNLPTVAPHIQQLALAPLSLALASALYEALASPPWTLPWQPSSLAPPSPCPPSPASGRKSWWG